MFEAFEDTCARHDITLVVYQPFHFSLQHALRAGSSVDDEGSIDEAVYAYILEGLRLDLKKQSLKCSHCSSRTIS